MMSLDDHSARVSVYDRHAGRAIRVVVERRALARAGFDRDRKAEFLQLRGDFGRRRDAAVAFVNFLWNADAHRVLESENRRTVRPG